LTASADLVPMEQVAMRTVQLRNPSLTGQMSKTIHFSVQILAPGERTIAHRALTAEARFVVDASPGAEFVVEGESFPMEAGDFVTTPSWCYHDHHNGSSKPAVWIDSMELALGSLNGPGIGNQLPEKYQPITKGANFSTRVLSNVKPAGVDWELQPPLRYRWGEAFGALTALKENEVEPDPYDGYRVSYAHPLTGGPTFPTRNGALQLLRSGQGLRPHRHNSTTLYYAARGSGVTTIDEERLEWGSGDIFLVPPWSWHSHANANSTDAVLFTMDDAPTMQALGYYREEGR
jgi:gentisate 1,2-dioxygenase